MAQDMIITCDACGTKAKVADAGDWVNLNARKVDMNFTDTQRNLDICTQCVSKINLQLGLRLNWVT